MYKLLMFFIFFSLVVNAQTVPPVTNQSNSGSFEEKEAKELRIEVQSAKVKPFSSEREIFELNVNHLQSELNSISLSSVRKTPTVTQQQQMEMQLKAIEQINKNSFEYHLLNYQVGNYDFSRVKSLEKAAKIKPNDIAVLKEFSAFSYIMKDEKELAKYLNSLNAMRVFSIDLELFAANLLKSLPNNSILITHGENDTYPLLIQQIIRNVRKDVEIISLEHLQSMEYRKRLKNEGFMIPNNAVVDTDFFREFMELNTRKAIVAAPSLPVAYLSKGEKLNSTGLGYYLFQNSDKNFNTSRYEKELKSLITMHANRGSGSDVISNYLPYLFDVRNEYLKKSDIKSIEEIEILILRIAELSNKQKQVKALMNK